MKFIIPVELRGKCKLFINGIEHELPVDVASIEVLTQGGGGGDSTISANTKHGSTGAGGGNHARHKPGLKPE